MGVTAREKGRGQKKSARFARHCFFSIMQCPAYTFALATPLILGIVIYTCNNNACIQHVIVGACLLINVMLTSSITNLLPYS